MLKDHQGESSEVLVSSLKNNEIDQNIYHHGSIDGNHYMMLAQKGEQIMKEIRTRMLVTMSKGGPKGARVTARCEYSYSAN